MPWLWRSVVNPILTEIRNDISGLELLRDWLGDSGLPVTPMVAEFRSHRCVSGNGGQPCPRNVEPNWWDKVKSEIALWIRKEIEVKEGMKLRVEHEDKVHMCSACGCCLKLKIWTPAVHLKAHITQKQIDKTPSYCWLRKELSY